MFLRELQKKYLIKKMKTDSYILDYFQFSIADRLERIEGVKVSLYEGEGKIHVLISKKGNKMEEEIDLSVVDFDDTEFLEHLSSIKYFNLLCRVRDL